MITTDGSFGEIARENFVPAEEQTVAELKTQGKPFLIVVNSQFPYKEETTQMVNGLQKKYQVPVVAVNCGQLKKEDVALLLEKILYEKLKSSLNMPGSKLEIFHSRFNGEAPLLGSIAVVANEIFSHQLKLLP